MAGDGAAGWWHGAVIYQIYPRSFADGDGDGSGDLPGIISRLDHVASLGVDAIWLNPIYPSGGADGGYDVTDYRAVDPVLGDLSDVDALLGEAHDRGLKVMLDFVPNHTSDRHRWFLESRSSRTARTRGWYVWADGRDGGPPNNWISTFGGPAWTRDPESGQFYLHSFLPQQPDLDWTNPAVREAMLGAMRFWADRGVDGFRLDVVNKLGKDALLRDNPPEEGPEGPPRYDNDMPPGHDHVRAMRTSLGANVALLGEVWSLDLHQVALYLGPRELDLAFNFPFAMSGWHTGLMGAIVDQTERAVPAGSDPCWHLANHDMPRETTRYGPQVSRAAAVLLLTLRGTAVIYQGQEIGMVDGRIPPERRVDPVGRDGCRTPMQWDASPNAGFCPPGVEPWLPVAGGFERCNVAAEDGDPASVLSLYRRLLAYRRAHPSLRTGRYGFVASNQSFWAYRRDGHGERHLVAVSFGDAEADVPAWPGAVAVASDPAREGERVGRQVRLRAGEALVVRLD